MPKLPLTWWAQLGSNQSPRSGQMTEHGLGEELGEGGVDLAGGQPSSRRIARHRSRGSARPRPAIMPARLPAIRRLAHVILHSELIRLRDAPRSRTGLFVLTSRHAMCTVLRQHVRRRRLSVGPNGDASPGRERLVRLRFRPGSLQQFPPDTQQRKTGSQPVRSAG